MPLEHTQEFCSTCNQMRLFTRQGINHLIHALVTLFLCGLWIPFWIGAALFDNKPFRCSFCGGTETGPREKFLPPEPDVPLDERWVSGFTRLFSLPAVFIREWNTYVRWYTARRHVVCECPYCDGRVEFLKSSFYELRRDRRRKYGPIITCPHCGKPMETYR